MLLSLGNLGMGSSVIPDDGGTVVLPQKRLLLIGDSTEYGRGASDAHSAGVVNAHAGSPVMVLAAAFDAAGIPADAHSVVGMGNNSSEDTTPDYFGATPDITIKLSNLSEADLWDSLSFLSVGGDLFRNNGSDGTLTFTFDNVDSAAIGLPIRTYGDIRYRIDGGTWITVSETGADDLLRIEIDFGPLGTHTVEFQRLTTTVYVSYVEAWNSNDTLILVPWGARGYDANDLNDTTRPWSYKSALSHVPFDAVIINIGINDVKPSASTTETSYTNDVEAYIQAVQAANASADCFLQIPNDINGGLDYVPAVLTTLAGTYGCTILDSRLAPDMSDFATADAAGKMFDDLHPSATGYAAEWNYFQPIISAVIFDNVDQPSVPSNFIDPPASSDLTVYYSFGFDRLVEEFIGDTVQLERLSDNTLMNFGFDSATGAFDMSEVHSWRVGADVDVSKLYDQNGTAEELQLIGTVNFIVSDVVNRFATDWSDVDGQLTRKSSVGGVGANLAGTGALGTGALPLPVSTGVEFHVLMSPNQRNGDATYSRTDTQSGVKTNSSAVITGLTDTSGNAWAVGRHVNGVGIQETTQIISIDSATQVTLTRPVTISETSDITVTSDNHGATSDSEYLFWYGLTETEFFRHNTGGDFKDYIRLYTGNSNTSSASDQTYHKKFGQYVYSYELNPTEWRVHNNGAVYLEDDVDGGNATTLAAGGFDDGGVIIGGRMDNNDFLDAQNTSDMIFGGLIITAPLTDNERFLLRSKLSSVGQQHRIDSLENVISLFDEVVLMKNVNPATGRVVGENGLLTLDFNLTDQGGGLPTWDFAQEQTDIGLTGISAVGQNISNGFKATDNYFAGVTTGTVMSIHLESTDNSTLSHSFVQADGSEFALNRTNMSLSLGYDHSPVSMMAMVADDRDDDGIIGGRLKADGSSIGYDQSNQAEAKYNRNVTHGAFDYGETLDAGEVDEHIWDIGNWQNDGNAPYLLDAPVVSHTADNISYSLKGDVLTFQIGTFKAPSAYDRADSYAVRKPLMLQSDNWSFASDGVSPIGHRDGSIAHNPYGSVVDSMDDARIMTRHRSQVFEGTRYALGFAGRVFSIEDTEKTQVNSWKFLTYN